MGMRSLENRNDMLRNMKKVKPGHTAFEHNSMNTFVLE
jgi:hypothetical protein